MTLSLAQLDERCLQMFTFADACRSFRVWGQRGSRVTDVIPSSKSPLGAAQSHGTHPQWETWQHPAFGSTAIHGQLVSGQWGLQPKFCSLLKSKVNSLHTEKPWWAGGCSSPSRQGKAVFATACPEGCEIPTGPGVLFPQAVHWVWDGSVSLNPEPISGALRWVSGLRIPQVQRNTMIHSAPAYLGSNTKFPFSHQWHEIREVMMWEDLSKRWY